MANSLDPPVKAVALDFDGPITNLDIDWNAAIRQASQIAGYDIKSLITFYENSHATPVFQKVSCEMERLELYAVATAQPKPYLENFLKTLQDKKIPAYIVSMQSPKPIHVFLDQHSLTSYFTGFLTRLDCPNKTTQIQLVAKQANLSPKQILLVDDSKRNIAACQQTGGTCFFFKRTQSLKELRETWNKILKLVATSQT